MLRGLGVAQGRPGRDLHADDPRAARGDAGLHPHRRRPLGGLRRLLPRRARRPHQRRRTARCSSPPTAAAAAGSRRCSSRTSTWRWRAHRRSSHVVVVQRTGASGDDDPDPDDRGPRPLVARAHGRRLDRVPGRAHGHRGPALPALHLGHHGQAQGHHAHHRRLPHPGRVHPQVRLRPPARDRRLLVRRRHRLGHRPQLHRLRARWPTGPRR